MSSYNNIEKIKYTQNTSEVVNLLEYIVFENELAEEKYIVFKFVNKVNQQLLGMEFEVNQYNVDNDLVEKSVVIYDEFLANPSENFVPNAKLKVNYACKTISIKLRKAAYDRFMWNEGEYEDNSYKFEHYFHDEKSQKPAAKPADKKAKKEKTKKPSDKKFELKNVTKKNIARFPAVFLAIIFIVVTAFVGVSLYFFEKRSDRFTLDNYDLRRIDGDTVSIYGYDGGERDELIIPAQIKGYRVVRIESGAFTDCQMSGVTISSDVILEKQAFVNCDKLAYIRSEYYVRVMCAPLDIFKGCALNPSVQLFNADYITG